MSHLTQTLHSRSKVKVTRPLSLVVLAGQHGRTLMVTSPCAYTTYIVSLSSIEGLGGGISWQALLLVVVVVVYTVVQKLQQIV